MFYLEPCERKLWTLNPLLKVLNRVNPLYLTDFIQAGDAENDLVPAIRRAVEQLKDGQTLIFPEGEYDLLQETAEQTLLPITNHDLCPRVHGILLRGKRDITIEGNGCRLYADGLVAPLWIQDCHNITVNHLTFDRHEFLNGSGEVVAAGDGWMELELPPENNPGWFIHNGILTFKSRYWSEQLDSLFEWDTQKRLPARGSADNCGAGWQVQWQAEQMTATKIRLSGSFEHPVTVGNQMMLRCSKRYAPGVSMSHSSDIKLNHITVHACGGMAFIGQRCRDVSLKRCVVAPSPKKTRIDADCFDATHFSNCAGHILIEDGRFENQLDDATNIHGAYFQVIRQLDAHTLRLDLRHPQQAGAPVGEQGDTFERCRLDTAEAYWTGKAAEVTIQNMSTVDVRFSEALPDNVAIGDALDNIDWFPDFTMRRCFMRGNRARNTLISTRGKVLMEENFFQSAGAAVQTAGAIGFWNESGPVHDLTLRKNTFDHCAYNAPKWGAAVLELKPNLKRPALRHTPYHRKILIDENTFLCAHDKVLDLALVSDLTFKNNKLSRDDGAEWGDWLNESQSDGLVVEDNLFAYSGRLEVVPGSPVADSTR